MAAPIAVESKTAAVVRRTVLLLLLLEEDAGGLGSTFDVMTDDDDSFAGSASITVIILVGRDDPVFLESCCFSNTLPLLLAVSGCRRITPNPCDWNGKASRRIKAHPSIIVIPL